MTGAETDIEVERKSGVVVRLFPRNIIRTLPQSAIYGPSRGPEGAGHFDGGLRAGHFDGPDTKGPRPGGKFDGHATKGPTLRQGFHSILWFVPRKCRFVGSIFDDISTKREPLPDRLPALF